MVVSGVDCTTLPETNIARKKWWFPIGTSLSSNSIFKGLCYGYVSFRGGRS